MKQVHYEGVSDGRPGPGIIRVHETTRDVNGPASSVAATTVTLLPEPRRHSPDGFMWGYGGSGPSDTALAILAHTLGHEPEPAMYHRFKFEVVAEFDREYFMISQRSVIDWICKYRGNRGSEHELHTFDPYRPDWFMPRCKVCQEFEDCGNHG